MFSAAEYTRPSIRPSARKPIGVLLGVAGVCLVLATAHARLTSPDHRHAPVAVVAPATVEMAPDPYEPTDRRAVVGYRRGKARTLEVVTLGPVDVEVTTADAFLRMRSAAADAGITLDLESGFRSDEKQAELYRAWRRGDGHKAARPGRSNHQSGRALDLVITDEATFEWLTEHARSFGFRRTVRSEPWHWEYTSMPRAAAKRWKKRGKRKGKRHRRKRR